MKIVDKSPVAPVIAFTHLAVGDVFRYDCSGYYFMKTHNLRGADGCDRNAVHLSPETRGTPCIFSQNTEVTHYSATLEVTRG